MPRVVIIGGGFGGLYAAKRFRRQDVEVTILDRRNHHVFQPLLYQVATAGLSPGDIASPIRWILRRQRNTDVLLADVARIDTASRTVHFTDGGSIRLSRSAFCALLWNRMPSWLIASRMAGSDGASWRALIR